MTSFKENEELHRFYGTKEEEKPPNAPEPRGKAVDLRAFVDADFSSNRANRRSRSGYFIYLNSAPIL